MDLAEKNKLTNSDFHQGMKMRTAKKERDL